MKPHQITRREVLAGITGAAGVGVAFGTGTAALASDESIFDSRIETGSLDLLVDWESDGDTGSSEGTVAVPVELTAEAPEQVVDLTVSVPDGDDANANAAFGWVRALCPSDGGLASQLDVTLRYENCDANCVLYSGPLAGLGDGLALDAGGDAAVEPGDQDCLQPGSDLALQLVVSVSDFVGRGAASFTLEFVGTQCRHASGVTSPFRGPSGCEEDADGGQHAISYVAFCTTSDGPLDPELDVLETTDGEPLSVAWTTAVDVDYVCVKAATSLTVYDYRNEQRTSGTATAGDPAAAIPEIELAPGEAATPCAVAARELDDAGDGSDLHSAKLEYEDGTWEADADE